MVQEFQSKENFLDSLVTHGLLSEDIYEYYRNKTRYEQMQFELTEGKLTVGEVARVLSFESKDTTINFTFFRDIIHVLINRKYTSNIKMMQSGNGNIRDYRILYDSLRKTTIISGSLRDALLARTMEDIIKNFSVKDIQLYHAKFIADVKDTNIIHRIQEDYKLTKPFSNDILLKNVHNEHVNFSSVLKEHRGKIVLLIFGLVGVSPV